MKMIISDITLTGHPESVRRAIITGSNYTLTTSDITITTQDVPVALVSASQFGAHAVIRSTTGLTGYISAASSSYVNSSGSIMTFVPLGSNFPVELTTPNYIPVIVTCGAGDTQNDTAYGNGLEFWDYDLDNNPGSDASSYSNGYIAGKLYYIKTQVSCSWWEARYRARMTATNNGVWDKFNGYGRIDTTAAIAYTGEIIDDPYYIIPPVPPVPVPHFGPRTDTPINLIIC